MKRAVAALALLGSAAGAHAHHAMDGATPATAFDGLVSGLAHPVIGPDHLLFVLALGVAAAFFGRGAGMLLVFIAGTLAGTALHLAGFTLPYAEAWVALTLIGAGCVFLSTTRRLGAAAGSLLIGLCGLAHGYAYGEAVVGAEPTPIAAYLAGFALAQLAIAALACTGARRLERARPAFALRSASGIALSLAGVAFLGLALG